MATYSINARQTFAAALLMGCAAKTKFGTADQDHTAAGLPKWEAQVAVTFLAEPGQRAQSEVISVTVAATSDPAASIAPGTPVDLEDLRLGVTAPQTRENGQGIRGGRPYWMASALRPAAAVNGRPKAEANA